MMKKKLKLNAKEDLSLFDPFFELRLKELKEENQKFIEGATEYLRRTYGIS